MKICPKCGEKFPDDANFCPMDANRLSAVEQPKPGPAARAAPSAPAGRPAAPSPGAAAAARPAPSPTGPALPSAASLSATLASPSGSGAVLGGRFLLGARLGGGHSGEVFSARDQQGGAQVVIKIVAPAVFPSPIGIERASRELRQLMRVASERIARIVEFGKTPDGRLFVASEVAPGASLDRLVHAEGPLTPGRARTIVLAIGEALGEAQKAGVIHRDVAPKNVLVGPEDRIKVINFSIPRPLTDKIFGVPEFLSPEQAEGKAVDQRSNIYSLGAILYYLVTGEPPFSAADARALCEMHLKAPAPLPSAKRPDLPPGLDRVVAKALEKNSSRRHLTLRQLLSEVEALPLDGVPTMEDRVGSGPPGRAAGAPAMAATLMAAPGTIPTGPVPQQVSNASAPRGVKQAGTLGGGQAPTKTVETIAAEAPPPMMGAPRQGMPATPSSGAFRETLWFKKGEVDQFLQQQGAAGAAPTAASPQAGPPAEAPAEDIRPLEDRYVDDGTVSREDREKFSLRTGATMFGAKLAVPDGQVPGERMSESEMMEEIHTGRKIGQWVLVAIGGLVVIGLLWFFLGRSRGSPPSSAREAAAPVASAPAPPALPPVPPAVPTPTAKPSPGVQPSAEGSKGTSPPPAAEDPVARALRAADRGHLTAPKGESAVDLLLDAKAAGAPAGSLEQATARVVKLLLARAHREVKRKDSRGAHVTYTAILRLRPGDRQATAALRDLERRRR